MSRSKWLTDIADGDASHDSDSKLTDWLSDFSFKPSGHIKSVSPLLNWADAHILLDDLTEALRLVNQVGAIAPASKPVQLKRPGILARQGRYRSRISNVRAIRFEIIRY